MKKTLSTVCRPALMAALFMLLFSFTPEANAQEQSSGLKMEARPAFDGHFKYGEWLPLWVQLENNGPDLSGELQVRVPGRTGTSVYAVEVSLPSGSRKLVPLYALPNNFSHALEVQLASKNQVLAKQSVTVRPQPNVNYMIGIVAPERGAMALMMGASLPGIRRTKVLVDLQLSDLPERPEGLRSFDALILNDLDTSSLTPSQKDALETWVHQGGRLIIGGGPRILQTASGLPDSLLPFIPSSFTEISSVSSLAGYSNAEEVRVPGPFVVATGDEPGGKVLVKQDGLPLVVELGLGSGFVDLIALDLALSPFDAWPGTASFWSALLSPNGAYPDWLPPDMSARQTSANQMIYALSNLPALDLPSIRSLSVLLAIYIILVGPVNYLVLRWRKRLHWAWITIPLITIIFSGGAFSLGYAMRGTDLLLNRVIVAELQGGRTANIRNYYGLFSPSQNSYEIEVLGGGLLSQLNADYDPWSSRPMTAAGEVVLLQQGDKNLVRGLSVNQWSMQSFMTEGALNDFGEISADLEFEQLSLRGTLSNETGVDLYDVVLVVGNQILRLGELRAGEDVPVNLQTPDLMGQAFGPPLSYRIFEQEFNRPMPSGPPRELQLKQSILDTVVPYGSSFGTFSGKFGGTANPEGMDSALLLGWFDSSSEDILVEGRVPAQQTTALLYTRIPFRLAEGGQVSVPPGLIAGSIIQMPVEGGMCGPSGSAAVYLGRGEAVFEFVLPERYRDVNIEELVVFIGTEGGWERVPETAIYNWAIEGWETLNNVSTGRNVIDEVEGFISPTNLVQVSLSSDESSVSGCYYVGLGLEGTR